jgi:hypothetical protein
MDQYAFTSRNAADMLRPRAERDASSLIRPSGTFSPEGRRDRVNYGLPPVGPPHPGLNNRPFCAR